MLRGAINADAMPVWRPYNVTNGWRSQELIGPWSPLFSTHGSGDEGWGERSVRGVHGMITNNEELARAELQGSARTVKLRDSPHSPRGTS